VARENRARNRPPAARPRLPRSPPSRRLQIRVQTLSNKASPDSVIPARRLLTRTFARALEPSMEKLLRRLRTNAAHYLFLAKRARNTHNA